MGSINCVYLVGKLYRWGIHTMPRVGSVVGEGVLMVPSNVENPSRPFLGVPVHVPVKIYGNRAKNPLLKVNGVKLALTGYLKDDTIVKPDGTSYSKAYVVITKFSSMDDTYPFDNIDSVDG